MMNMPTILQIEMEWDTVCESEGILGMDKLQLGKIVDFSSEDEGNGDCIITLDECSNDSSSNGGMKAPTLKYRVLEKLGMPGKDT